MKAVIFDLDGTLLNTIGDLAAAVNHALKTNGFKELSENTIKTYVGNGARLLIARSLEGGFENPLYEKCRSDFSAYYLSHLTVRTKPYDGVTAVLKALKEKGVKTAILSNKPHAATAALSAHFFGSLIDAAAGEKEGVNKKPSPDGVNLILKELGAAPKDAVYIGDSEVDIETAKNSSLKCISCSWGFKGKDFLIKNGAEIIADSPEEILKYI